MLPAYKLGLASDDYLVLATDGLWDVVTSQEVRGEVRGETLNLDGHIYLLKRGCLSVELLGRRSRREGSKRTLSLQQPSQFRRRLADYKPTPCRGCLSV